MHRPLVALVLLLGLAAPALAGLVVEGVRGPRTARLTNRHPVARVPVAVHVRNTGAAPVTLADAAAALAAVGLRATPGDGDVVCPTPAPVARGRKFPRTIRPGKRRTLRFEVPVACASRAVGTTTLPLVDGSRPTPPNGTAPGLPERALPTWVWYPATTDGADAPLAAGGPFPLVIFSHGLGSFPQQSEYLMRHLASHGWIVAAPQYPLGHLGTPGGQTIGDKKAEAGDVSFVIDVLLGATTPDTARFAGAIDGDRIALTGHSAGGLLTLVAGYDATVRDPRVKAAAPLAPAACFLDDGYFGAVAVPLLLLHGDADLLLAVDAYGRRPWSFANAPKRLGIIAGGNHMGFADAGTSLDDLVGCTLLPPFALNAAAAIAMIDSLGGAAAHLGLTGCPLTMCVGDPAHVDARRQQQITKEAVLAFFEAEVRGDAAARAFLDGELPATTPELTLESAP
jgi:predicted dienelactone hydrolase